jgi:hypothetical protein
MATTYTYQLSDFKAATEVDISALQEIVEDSSIASAVIQYINSIGTTYNLVFGGALSGGDQTTLNGIIATYVFATTMEETVSNISETILINKSLTTDTNFFIDEIDNTKKIGFDCVGNTTGTIATLLTATTANRTYTFPDATDTIVLLSASQILLNKTANNLVIGGTGSTTAGSASFYSNPASTTFSGANNYFFNYFNTPASSGSTTGSAYTVYVANAPANATTPFALYVNSGKTYIGGALQIPTGAGAGLVLTSDASGNTSWTSPGSIGVSFGNGTVGAPSIFFTTQTSTGFYKPADGEIGITTSGVLRVQVTTTGTTFTGAIRSLSTSNQVILGVINTTTISATTPSLSRTYTLPDAGANANFILSAGSGQTIAGGLTSSGTLTASNGLTLTTGALNLTSSSGAISLTGTSFTTNTALTITPTSNQIVLRTGSTITINASAPSASRVYTLPDAGAAANFLMSAGTQTATGINTFSSATTATSSATGGLIVSGGIGIGRNMWLGGSFSASVTTGGAILNIPALTYTNSSTAASGTATDTHAVSIATPTVASTNTNVTTTSCSTLRIGGAPIKGTNQTLTNSYGLFIDSSNVAGTVTEASSLHIAGAPTVIGGNTYAMRIAGGTARIDGTLQIPTGAGLDLVLTSDANGNASWASSPLAEIKVFSATLSTTIRTNSTTPQSIGISTTPTTAGTYLILLELVFRVSSNNRAGIFQMIKNTTAIADTSQTRTLSNANSDYMVVISGTDTANGTSDAFSAVYRRNAGSNINVTLNYRKITAIRIG